MFPKDITLIHSYASSVARQMPGLIDRLCSGGNVWKPGPAILESPICFICSKVDLNKALQGPFKYN